MIESKGYLWKRFEGIALLSPVIGAFCLQLVWPTAVSAQAVGFGGSRLRIGKSAIAEVEGMSWRIDEKAIQTILSGKARRLSALTYVGYTWDSTGITIYILATETHHQAWFSI
jgi:hypothetical protein